MITLPQYQLPVLVVLAIFVLNHGLKRRLVSTCMLATVLAYAAYVLAIDLTGQIEQVRVFSHLPPAFVGMSSAILAMFTLSFLLGGWVAGRLWAIPPTRLNPEGGVLSPLFAGLILVLVSADGWWLFAPYPQNKGMFQLIPLGGAAAVRRGGLFPVHVLRLFRANAGQCEARWMDEHIRVHGDTKSFHGHILDDNLKPLNWWIDKHNTYASREVVDLLNLKHRFLPHETIADAQGGQAGRKRWIKEVIFARLPPGSRAVLYFMWRFVFRLGFLDSRQGRSFHLLQGLWYRYLVDMKLREVQAHMRARSVDPPTAVREVLDINVT